MGLCFRCEHRAKFLEDGHAPRCECGDIKLSVSSCYMYIPVKPCITIPRDLERPRFGPTFISAREEFHRVPGDHEIKLRLNKFHNNEVLLLYEKVKNDE
jgi:hypothetical protein